MYSSKLCSGTTKSKSSISFIANSSIFVIHLVNGTQILIALWVTGYAPAVISPLTSTTLA